MAAKDVKHKILAIDDDADILKYLSDLLTGLGYDVRTASGGKEALEISCKETFEAALVDINLPDIPGTELITLIKSNNPNIESIIITGSATLDNTIKAIEEGAFAYLLKPIKIDELKAYLIKALEKRTAAIELEEKINELRKFNEIAADRSIKEVELQKEINSLLIKSGKQPKYKL